MNEDYSGYHHACLTDNVQTLLTRRTKLCLSFGMKYLENEKHRHVFKLNTHTHTHTSETLKKLMFHLHIQPDISTPQSCILRDYSIITSALFTGIKKQLQNIYQSYNNEL